MTLSALLHSVPHACGLALARNICTLKNLGHMVESLGCQRGLAGLLCQERLLPMGPDGLVPHCGGIATRSSQKA